MMDAVHALLAVQELDTRADQLRHRRGALPERAARDAVAARLTGLQGQHREVEAARAVLAGEQEQLEATVAAGERKRASLEAKSRTTFVPRDAQAIADELNGIAARQADTEDHILELMEQVEPLDEQLAALAVQAEEAGRELVTAAAALQAAEVTVDAELAQTVAERAAAAAEVPPTLLQQYEKQRVRLGGVAVARLEGARCLGCHLELPRAEVEEIRHQPADALVTCPQCQRILVRS
jgi:predicted  nucleic acid-binding Zn-ribbon protein